jgi:hypothetical protein
VAGRLRLLICALALGGCGEDARPVATAPAATPAPAELVERARECGLAAPGAGLAVPADLAPLLPARSVVTSVEPAGAGYRAVFFSGEPLVQTLAALGTAGAAAGYSEEFREREAIDAELTLRAASGSVIAFMLATPARCGDGVRVTVVRIG